MENNETTQQSSQSSQSKLARSNRRSGKLVSLSFLLKLLKRWPLIIWSGVGVFLIAITAISIFSLTYTGRVQKEKPASLPVEQPVQPSSRRGDSLWLLGAIVITCAVGSVVIAQRWKTSRAVNLRQRVKSSSKTLTRRQQRKRAVQESPSITTDESAPPAAPAPTDQKPVVTVLPPEENHPSDTSQEQLAEMMDIRKHKSLSSILDNSKKHTD